MSETSSRPVHVFQRNELHLITSKVVFVARSKRKKDREADEERERERGSLFGAWLHTRKPRILPFNYPGF